MSQSKCVKHRKRKCKKQSLFVEEDEWREHEEEEKLRKFPENTCWVLVFMFRNKHIKNRKRAIIFDIIKYKSLSY